MKKVVIVDRSSAFLKLMEIIIARLGYGTSSVDGTEECLRVMRGEGSDLVLTEMKLADGTGPELCRTIREDPALAEIPVVIITTDNREEMRQQAFNSGCDDYLTKPLTVRPLFASLEKLVGNRRRKQIRTTMASFADVTYRGDSLRMETFNFGEGGVFLKTKTPLPVGEVIDLTLALPGRVDALKVQGEVLYAFGSKMPGHPPGMGVKFIGLDEGGQRLLSRYVEQYVTRDLPAERLGFTVPGGADDGPAPSFQLSRPCIAS